VNILVWWWYCERCASLYTTEKNISLSFLIFEEHCHKWAVDFRYKLKSSLLSLHYGTRSEFTQGRLPLINAWFQLVTYVLTFKKLKSMKIYYEIGKYIKKCHWYLSSNYFHTNFNDGAVTVDQPIHNWPQMRFEDTNTATSAMGRRCMHKRRTDCWKISFGLSCLLRHNMMKCGSYENGAIHKLIFITNSLLASGLFPYCGN
jgi:hypothetical protein